MSRPLELESYAKWVYLLEWPTKLDFFPPVECFGGFHRLLLISSFWPLGLILLVSVASIGLESGARRKRHILATTRAGLQGALPTILVLTFLVLPNTATRIFNSFVCETYKLDDAAGLFRRYLRDDMSLSCDSAEFGEMRTDAIILMAVWPCGVPLMYAALLWASRRAIIDDTPTPLSRSVGFLSNDCALAHAIKDMLPIPHSASFLCMTDKLMAFWWEPIEVKGAQSHHLVICSMLTLDPPCACSPLRGARLAVADATQAGADWSRCPHPWTSAPYPHGTACHHDLPHVADEQWDECDPNPRGHSTANLSRSYSLRHAELFSSTT